MTLTTMQHPNFSLSHEVLACIPPAFDRYYKRQGVPVAELLEEFREVGGFINQAALLRFVAIEITCGLLDTPECKMRRYSVIYERTLRLPGNPRGQLCLCLGRDAVKYAQDLSEKYLDRVWGPGTESLGQHAWAKGEAA